MIAGPRHGEQWRRRRRTFPPDTYGEYDATRPSKPSPTLFFLLTSFPRRLPFHSDRFVSRSAGRPFKSLFLSRTTDFALSSPDSTRRPIFLGWYIFLHFFFLPMDQFAIRILSNLILSRVQIRIKLHFFFNCKYIFKVGILTI